jgi:hypothetical protein
VPYLILWPKENEHLFLPHYLAKQTAPFFLKPTAAKKIPFFKKTFPPLLRCVEKSYNLRPERLSAMLSTGPLTDSPGSNHSQSKRETYTF